MERYISLNIHTESLHEDKRWQRTRAVLGRLFKNNIKATWFALNPSFSGYRAMGFDEEKWKERLKFINQKNQNIEQHTHFYKGKEGVPKGEGYDLGPENVLERIGEDRLWLKNQGYEIKGFISGAWRINDKILQILAKEGYSYDLSSNNLDLKEKISVEEINGLLKVPATASIKRFFLDLILLKFKRRFLTYRGISFCTIHFHDFDLDDLLNYWILVFLILFSNFFNLKFVSIGEIYKKIIEQ